MTPVETIAFLIILGSAIKIVMLLINPSGWLGFAKKVWANKGTVKFISIVVAAVLLYYIVQEISIIQILATTAFVASLMVFGMASEAGMLIRKYENKIKRGKIWKEYWLYTLIWIALMIWGVKALFF